MQNNDLTFFNTLKIRLKEDIDGKKFHEKFLPEKRDFFSPRDEKAIDFRKSAVMITLFFREKSLRSLLIQRAVYPGAHSGQISLPGGKQDLSDKNLLETAIRETFEEISVRVDENEVIGSLSPLTIPISQFTVYPFIALLPQTPNYKSDENEVVGIIEYDVWDFVHHANIDIYKVKGVNTELEAPAFNINGHIVWGATAMILNEFREIMLEVLKNHNPPPLPPTRH